DHGWAGEQQWPPAPPEAAAGRPRRGRAARWVGVGSLVLALGLVGGLAGGALYDRLDSPAATYPDVSLPAPPSGTTARPAGSVAGIAAAALPSVVSLQVEGADGEGTGSGFVLDERGFVLTNNHVVAGAREGGITVVFEDGVQVSGEVVGADASYDLAVVRVERDGLRALTMGDSAAVVVGDPVVAVGAPLGLQGTVTEGIVSALKRPVTAGEATGDVSYIQALQTDAAINPGNSGGPLLNTQGEVVGVNSAIAQLPGQASAGGSIGLGFSIPSNQARRTAEQLIRTGRAVHPVIGVSLDPAYSGEGVQILDGDAPDGSPAVQPDGPAAQAGLRPGDVILAIDGRPVTTSEELIVDIRAREPGDTVTLAVRRGGGSVDVQVVLKADG
ncbi:PDZ domain-containing protein, partial [Kineococcus sp. R8]|uniref:S1C family serine protease n=1 Tax=Kineococcus siccus TaxID=2696567 RepID=UPI00141307A4